MLAATASAARTLNHSVGQKNRSVRSLERPSASVMLHSASRGCAARATNPDGQQEVDESREDHEHCRHDEDDPAFRYNVNPRSNDDPINGPNGGA